ncbi:MAG: hypothetical protein ACPL7I_09430 [Myxococcota bacterium]
MNWKRAYLLFSVVIFYSFNLYAGYLKVKRVENTCDVEYYPDCCRNIHYSNVFEC